MVSVPNSTAHHKDVTMVKNDNCGEEIHKVSSAQSRESAIQHASQIHCAQAPLAAEIIDGKEDGDDSILGDMPLDPQFAQYNVTEVPNLLPSPSGSKSVHRMHSKEHLSDREDKANHVKNSSGNSKKDTSSGMRYSLSTSSFKSAFKFSSSVKGENTVKSNFTTNTSKSCDPKSRRNSQPLGMIIPSSVLRRKSPDGQLHSSALSLDLATPAKSQTYAAIHSPSSRSSMLWEQDVLGKVESRVNVSPIKSSSKNATPKNAITSTERGSITPPITPTNSDRQLSKLGSDNSNAGLTASLAKKVSSSPSTYTPKLVDQLWLNLRPKILESMRDYQDIRNGIPVQWISTVSSNWAHGTGSIDPVTTTLTLLSETCQLIIPDLRSAIVIANPLKRCVELILNPPQSACSRIVISATSENDYIHWIGFLLLFTNLKKKGIQNKIFIPRVVVPMSDLIQLKSKLRVFIPGLHYNSNNTRRRSSTQSISSSLKLRDSSTSQTQNTTSASNITNGISASTITTEDDKYYGFPRSQSFPFSEIDKWTLMTGHLTEEGIMNLYLDDGSFFQNIDIKKVLASRIRPVDDTLFEMSNVMYIKATGAVIEDKSNDRLHIVKGLNKNKSSEKLFNPKSQENHIFFQFQTQSDLEDWFTYLRSFSKKRFLCLSSGNMLKGVRMGRTINVRVVEGRVEATNVDDTINSQNPFCDAYVEIQFEGITWARTFVSKSKTPFWREDFVFGDFPVLGPTLKFVLKKRLSHKVSHVMDPTIGVVILTENELKNNGGQEKWYPIMRDNNLTKRTVGQIPMSLSIKIDYDETEILAPQYYKRLGELLTDLSNNVTSELSDMTGDINSMSDICLKILQTEDKTVEWFMKLMDVEFNRLREILQSHPLSPQLPEYKKNIDNTLFRGNSLLTKALERYMKLVGGQYLDRVVGEFTREIVEKQACLEIDPSRIVDQENVTAIVGSNQRKLRSYAEQLWKVIESSIEDIPKSFRLLFKKLRLELYDDLKQDESLVFNSISGFLFLRYICPALLNPKLFGLIRSHPSIDAQRSLTLITKILQCFANRVRFGLKEPWMIPMNEFIESREPDLIEFYRKLTLIEEEDSGESTKSITFKEAPVKSVMDDNLSNPYLLDKYENYARLVKLLNSVPEGQFKGYLEASGKKIAPITASPSTNSFEFPRNTSNDNLENISSFNPDRTILKEFMSECRNIETKTRDIISKLENVEILEQSELEDIISHTQLQFNPESGHILLQSTRISYETPEVYKRNRSKSTAVKTRLKQNNANKSFQNEEVKSISENESTANLIATPVIRGPAYRAEESDTSAEEKTKSKSIMSRWIKKKLS